jgi:uncharacterized protein
MISVREAREFLVGRRIAVIGASDDRANFGRTIVKELRAHGFEVVAVNPSATTVDGDRCYPDVFAVPGVLDGAIVMVNRSESAAVVRGCIERGIRNVWLFKGIGGGGAVSDEAVGLCRQHGVAVVAGACPLMFLEPVAWPHRLHRFVRRHNGSLVAAADAATVEG